ncbi:MAG: diheme cytochrome c [Pseudomonadota bacterium]
MNPFRKCHGAWLALLLPLAGLALADGPRLPPLQNQLWQQECGSCHLAYHPGLLPAASWTAVMDGLGHHFGSDASLAADEEAALRRFLTAHAGTGKQGRAAAGQDGKPLLRISQMPWFRHEHSEELPPGVWTRKEVGSPANCAACHGDAASGRFSEREIRVPGGRR